jgi:cell division protein FtsB
LLHEKNELLKKRNMNLESEVKNLTNDYGILEGYKL